MYCTLVFDCEPPLPVTRIEHVDREVEVSCVIPLDYTREAAAMTMILLDFNMIIDLYAG